MFTGIIETTGTILKVLPKGSNIDFWIESTVTPELKIDQSVAHNGVCLTVVEIEGNSYRVTAVDETLQKTNLGQWAAGSIVNIERSLKIGDRLDGHFVQGHVDATATCTERKALEGSHLYTFSYPRQFAALLIEKGSVCINGVSLTAFNVTDKTFTVTIIPYTYSHTNFHAIDRGTVVNIEFDVLGKYLLRKDALNYDPKE
ncbi:MAG: riboflavin synthase subunit alpha [Bacteroidetes bacterium 46-16]|nr:MAG: riboflavin synthase subunit alpha [Bacteroidetes bacterium 46-16]